MRTSYRFASVAIALVIASLVQVAGASVVIQHSGSADPTTEGWSVGGTPTVSPVVSGGTPAWQVADNTGSDSGNYRRTGTVNNLFTPAQQIQFLQNGWVATWNVEVVSNSLFSNPRGVETSVTVNIAGTEHRFTLDIGREGPIDDQINPTGPDLEISLGPGGTIFEFAGAGSGFHEIKLVGTATSDTAALYFDGAFVTNYTAPADSGNYYWGSVSDGGTSVSNWNLVQFAVPEPAGATLLAVGGFALLGVRRARR